MKSKLLSCWILCAPAISTTAQTNLPLTNDVPIVDYGMRLALCDNFADSASQQAVLGEKELDAEKDIAWVLHNASTNDISVIFLGYTNSFNFKLFNSNGTEVPKTSKGKAMSVGPKSLTSIQATNPHAHRMGGGGPGSLLASDFPKLTELFEFPSNGTYVLEVRYWAWSSQKRFVLSEPVRVRVLKGDSAAPAPK